MSMSPAVILYNADGTAVVTITNGAAYGGSPSAMPIAGKDGSGNAQIVRTANDGTVRVDPTGTTAQPVTGPLTDAQLRAAAVPVSDGGGSLTVDGTVTANAGSGPWPVTDNGGSLTVDGTVSVAGTVPVSIAGTVAVSGPLTDTQLRATPVPVSGTVTANAGSGVWPVNDNGGSLTVDGPLTDAQLRATAVPVSMASGGYGGQVEGRAADGAAVVGNPVLVGGSDGTNAQALLTDALGRLVVAPAGVAGSAKGFSAGEVVLAATAVVPIRSTTYTEQSSNATRSVASSSANDTAAGTGARTVRITYYTATMTGPFTTDVTLNGTTAVATSVADICFIERIEVLTVGSTGSNVGIITLYVNNAGGGGTVWTIAATANQTKGAHHYCPTGKTCFITGLLIGIKGADTTSGFLRSKNPTVAAAAEIQISDVVRAPSSGQNFRSYGTAIAVPGPSRITVFAAPDSTSSRTYYGSFDFYEE